MDAELVETLRFIIDRCDGRTHDAVFILMADFPWFHERNGQLTRLYNEGMITKPFFSDDGASIHLTHRGRHFFDERPMKRMLTECELYSVLVALSEGASIVEGLPGLGKEDTYRAIRQLQDEGFIRGAEFVDDGTSQAPFMVFLGKAFVTIEGRKYLASYGSPSRSNGSDCDLMDALVSACAKIADNPSSYMGFDEDGLNRELRNFLDSSLSPSGYKVSDQTQQGLGNSMDRPGELDIRISKGGIPVAILEGLIHRDERYLREHVEKVTGRYNFSGCKTVLIIEYTRNKDFVRFWKSSCEILEGMQGIDVAEVDVGLLGVRLLRGTYDWNGTRGTLVYVGVNCCSK